MKLLTYSNTKIKKGEKAGYLTAIMHLAPADLSGYNVCPKASPGCKQACLNMSGMGAFSNVQAARIKKTKAYFEDKANFEAQLEKDIASVVRKADRKNLKPAIRINGTSDLPALAIKMARKFPDVQFYDYTAIPQTLERDDLPTNYHLTFSCKETDDSQEWAKYFTRRGQNVAVVFHGELPKRFADRDVIDGDENDLRFLDPDNVIVGLRAKGPAKKDKTGFAR